MKLTPGVTYSVPVELVEGYHHRGRVNVTLRADYVPFGLTDDDVLFELVDEAVRNGGLDTDPEAVCRVRDWSLSVDHNDEITAGAVERAAL